MSVAIKRKVLPVLTSAVILLVTVTVVSSVAAVRKCKWLITAVNDAAGVYDEELSRAIYKMADSSVVDRMEFHSRNIEYDSEKYGSVEDWRSSWYDQKYKIWGFKGIMLGNRAFVFYNYTCETHRRSDGGTICGSVDIPCRLELALTADGWKIENYYEPY